MQYNDDIMFVVNKFKDKEYHLKKIESLNNELNELRESRTYGVSSVKIKDVIIENRKPFNMDKEHCFIEKERELKNKIYDHELALDLIQYYYSLIQDSLVRECVELLYFKHTRSDIVSQKINYDRRAMYRRINKELKNNVIPYI